MKLYQSRYREKENNTLYPTETEINSFSDLLEAVKKDHIAARMKDFYRNSDNFQAANCLMLDLDNTHSDDPDDWKTIDDVVDAFYGVPFYYIHSRNHMKVKTKTASDGTVTHYEPRPKYHCYFPLSRTYTDFKEYESLLLKAAGRFPFFDLSAAKPAQPFFGVEKPTGGEIQGEYFLDDCLKLCTDTEIAESVYEFTEKFGARNAETQKAVKRLFSYLGLPEPDYQQDAPGAIDQGAASEISDAEYSEEGYALAKLDQRRSFDWLKDWAQKHNIALGRTYSIKSREHPEAICVCVPCPWESEHTTTGPDNETIIMIELGGKLCFLCRHSHCAGRSWRDYREYYENRDAQKPGQAAVDLQPEAGQLPGLANYSDLVSLFETADDRHLELKSFPAFSAAAKIKVHDSVVIAADTGAGKSSLALNFLHDLNEEYPCIYINLEMDVITVWRRLAAIHSGIELDRIERYRSDSTTAAAVNTALRAITSRQPLQVLQNAYTLQEIEEVIKQSTAGREDPTIVIIDHSLLVDTRERTSSRYERFTLVSEGLRKLALSYNIVLFILLQQNREGKKGEDTRPGNSSLKESGSWENDATQICFLWYDPSDHRKKLILTKNRSGSCGEFALKYSPSTQTYKGDATTRPTVRKPTRRERMKQKLLDAYETAYFDTFEQPTIQDMAEAADVTTSTIKSWMKECGGFSVNGKRIEPAGIDSVVVQDIVRYSPEDEDEPAGETAGNGQPVARNRM